LSLAGIPPTAGFIGKLFLFMSAINAGAYVLAFSLAANSVISVYYYWMLVRRMFIEPGEDSTPATAAAPLVLVISLSTLAILTLGLFFQPLMDAVAHALSV
jgi:NADH-quinone oxidoreductase subunit N